MVARHRRLFGPVAFTVSSLILATSVAACSSSSSGSTNSGATHSAGSKAAGGSPSASGGANSALEAKAQTYYKGKTITLITKSAPGGNGNATAQLLSQYLPKYLAGSPKVIVKVDSAGSGSSMMKNVSQVYPADGTNIALPDTAVVLRWMFKQAGTDYPLDKMPIAGDFSTMLIDVVATSAGKDVKTLAARTTPLKAGNTAPGGTGVIDISIGFKLLGIPVKEVYGYKGAGPVALAIERGEIDTASPAAGSFLSGYKTVVDEKKAYPLYQVGTPTDDGKLVRSKQFPDIPTLQDLYQQEHGSMPSGADWDAVVKLANMTQLGLFLALRPGTPPEALLALREAFQKMASDTTFAAQVNKTLGGSEIITADEAQKRLQTLLNTDSAMLATIKAAANPK